MQGIHLKADTRQAQQVVANWPPWAGGSQPFPVATILYPLLVVITSVVTTSHVQNHAAIIPSNHVTKVHQCSCCISPKHQQR